MNLALYKREMKGSLKILIIFGSIITLYVSVIISMYDKEMMAMLDQFAKAMPELMAAMGMKTGETSLLGFMISYLYGFILLVFPMVFSILRGNGLIAKYVDNGSMYSLLSSPVKREKIVLTQVLVLVSGIFILVFYSTLLEIIISSIMYPHELCIPDLLRVNLGLLFLQLFIGGICFLASCLFQDTKYSIALGAGLPAFMYVLQMLANVGGNAEVVKYFTFFSLFNANDLLINKVGAIVGIIVLLIGSIILYTVSSIIFVKKDLSI